MQDFIILEWTYSPPDYFEVPVAISRDDYQITIQDGKVEAKLESSDYDSDPSTKDIIEDALNHRFRGIQLLTHREYKLSYAGRYRMHPDGHRDVFLTVAPAKVKVRASLADIVIVHKDGTLYDSRKERIDKETDLANLAEKHGTRDGLARSLLESYHASVSDPDNELVHLYEICDALVKGFGGETKALSALTLTKSKWSSLHRLANNEPLKQGRHRGKFTGKLRDATEAELKEARDIAQSFIIAYLRYLDQPSS